MDNTFTELRKKAEQAVKTSDIDVSTLSPDEITHLIQDLEVHRVELEMQNDELQRANKENEEARRRYAELFDFAPVGYITLAADLSISESNLTFAHLVGLPRERILKMTFTDFLCPAFQDAFYLELRKIGEKNEKHALDMQIRHREKDFIWVHTEILSRDHGQTYFVSVNDVTLRKHAEAELKASEAKFRDLFDVVVDPMFIHDFEGKFLEVNKSACCTLGYSCQELLGMGVAHVDSHFSAEQLTKTLHELHHQGELLFETTHKTRDNRHFPVEVHTRVIEFEGKPAVLSLARDISRRKEAEQRYELLSNVTFEGILLHKNGIAIDVNASVSRLTGYAREELAGSNLFGFIATPEDREKARQNMLAHNTHPYTIRIRRKNGSIFDGELESREIDYQGERVRIVALRDVTERKRAQEELKKSEERFRAMFEQASAGMVTVTPDGRFGAVNQTFCDMLGYRKQELLQLDAHLLTWPEEADAEMPYIHDVIAGKRDSYHLEKRFRHQDGHPIWADLSSTVVRDEQGSIRYAIGVVVDITDRKKAEDALKASEEENKRLADATFEAIFFSEKGICTNQNTTAERLFGYTLDEAVGRPATEWIHPKDRELVKENMMRGTAGPYEATALRKDGSTFPCEIQAKTAIHDDRKVRITALRDITDRKQAELALKESEEKFRSIVENVNDIIYAITPDGVFTYISPNWKDMLGHDMEEVIGHNFAQFVYPEDVSLCADFLQKVLTTGEKQSGVEYRVKHKNGSWRWHFSNGSPIKDSENMTVSYIGVARDVTERKQQEEQLKHRLNYEKSLAQFSSTLLQNIPDAIDKALQYILQCSETSRIYIFENFHDSADGLCMKQIHEVCVDGVEAQIDNPILQHVVYESDGFSRWKKELSQDRIILGNIEDFPSAEQDILAPQEILAILIIPLWVNREWFGFIGFDDVQSKREWDAEDVRLLRTVAQMVGAFIERTQGREALQDALAEKEVLLKEIHHRVKNNMQTIASLLFKQQQYVDNAQTKAILQDSVNRVKSMALIHEQIYRSESLARINLAEYLRSLARKLFHTYKPKESMISLTVDVQDVFLPIDTSIPVALIVNELMTNALKYAFPEGQSGDIHLHCSRAGNVITLTVSDDGIGLPEGIAPEHSNSLGLYLVYHLATRQLGGAVELHNGEHTEFVIRFTQ